MCKVCTHIANWLLELFFANPPGYFGIGSGAEGFTLDLDCLPSRYVRKPVLYLSGQRTH